MPPVTVCNITNEKLSRGGYFFLEKFGHQKIDPDSQETGVVEWLEMTRVGFICATFNSLLSLVHTVADIAFYFFSCLITCFCHAGLREKFSEKISESFSLISSIIIGLGGSFAPDYVNRYLELPFLEKGRND